MNGEAGKGDRYRPVNKKVYDENYERIFRMKKNTKKRKPPLSQVYQYDIGIVVWINRSGEIFGSYFDNWDDRHSSMYESLSMCADYFREYGLSGKFDTTESLYNGIQSFLKYNDAGQMQIITNC